MHGLHLGHVILILLILDSLRCISAVLNLKSVLQLQSAVLEFDDFLHNFLLVVALGGPEDVFAGFARLGLRFVGAGLYLCGFGVGVAAAVGYADVFGDRGGFGAVLGARPALLGQFLLLGVDDAFEGKSFAHPI